jgi:regulator of replication initiation timing
MTTNDAIKITTYINESSTKIKYLERENDILRRENEFLRELLAKPKPVPLDIKAISDVFSAWSRYISPHQMEDLARAIEHKHGIV